MEKTKIDLAHSGRSSFAFIKELSAVRQISLTELSKARNLALTDLVKVTKGGVISGTWMHEESARHSGISGSISPKKINRYNIN